MSDAIGERLGAFFWCLGLPALVAVLAIAPSCRGEDLAGGSSDAPPSITLADMNICRPPHWPPEMIIMFTNA